MAAHGKDYVFVKPTERVFEERDNLRKFCINDLLIYILYLGRDHNGNERIDSLIIRD